MSAIHWPPSAEDRREITAAARAFKKSDYNRLSFLGFTWGAYDAEKDLHVFQRGTGGGGSLDPYKYEVMQLTTAMVKDRANAEYMAAHGLSYEGRGRAR